MKNQPTIRFPFHIVVIYCLTGTAWVLFSDLLVEKFVPAAYYGVISIAKGWLFIIVTAAILALLLRRYQRTQAGLERRMREIIDNLPSALYVFDREGRSVLFNRAMVTLLGHDGKSCLGKPRGALGIPPEAAAEHRANDLRVFETGQPIVAEEENLQTDGRHTYLTVKFPLTADDGSIEAVCGISTDITERKEAEAEREQYFKFFQSSSNLMCIAGTDGYFKKINPSFPRKLGYSEDELLSRPYIEFVHPDDRSNTGKEVARQLQGGLTLHFQNRYIHKHGSLRWLSWRANFDRQDGLFYAIASDITEQKLAEEEREKLQRQLNQSQKMEALGQLAGGVAHDFNNILSVIMGYGHILKMGTNLDSQQQEKVDHIIAAAEKAAQLTGGLLAFSRKQVLAPQTVNLNDIVQHLQKFLVRIIGEDIHLKTILNDIDLPVSVDSGQIEQALINLATNARDAMPQGGLLTFETGIQQIDAPFTHAHGYGQTGSYAVVTVADTGCGMDEETRKKIFEPFFTTKETGKGTGLGLAIAYGIIKQHNGFINIYSEPDKGTTCRIYLPLAPQESQATEAPVVLPPPRGGSETILVAEDEPNVRELMTGVLTGYGYEVLLAENGREAVEQFVAHRDRIAMILMDMIMPRQSGKAAADEIRQLQPEMKILFSSGYTADFIRNRGVDDEGMELIMKPFQPLDLLRKIREMLDRQ